MVASHLAQAIAKGIIGIGLRATKALDQCLGEGHGGVPFRIWSDLNLMCKRGENWADVRVVCALFASK